jgi:hypothetical protein
LEEAWPHTDTTKRRDYLRRTCTGSGATVVFDNGCRATTETLSSEDLDNSGSLDGNEQYQDELGGECGIGGGAGG